MVLYKDRLGDKLSSLPQAFGQDDIMENGDAVLRGLVFDLHIMGKMPAGQRENSGIRTYRGGNSLTSADLGKTLRLYRGCTFESGDIDVTKHQIIVSNATFRALDASGNPEATDNTNNTPVTGG